MPQVLRTPRARLDLLDIWAYIAQHNSTAADNLLVKFDDLFNLLAERPQMGELRPELAAEIRSFSLSRYVIFFRYQADAVVIVRVLGGEQDIDTSFFTGADLGL